jgi:small-conductance mechanosensitive channel
MVQIAPYPKEDGSRIWQFTPDTLETVRALYIALEDLPKSEFVTADETTSFFKLRSLIRSVDRGLLKPLGGLERWQWIALVIVICISVPIGWLVTGLMGWMLRYGRLARGRMAFRKEFRLPIRLFIIGILLLVSLRFVGLPEAYDVPLRAVVGVILALSSAWLCLQLISRISELYGRYGGRLVYQDEILRSLVTSLLKVAVVIGAIFFLANILSIPIQGVVAGLGIGGLAVALAARSTIENFIGGITLFADKPIRVGDLCRVGDRLGTVEAIGLRSVRLRGVDRVLVTIPNTEFVNLNIENFTRRDRILLKTTIQLRYETTPDQLRWVLAEIRKMLLQHPFVSPDPARARFAGFGACSLDIELFAYLETTDFNTFLAIREDVFLRVIDIVDASGTSFAFPSVVNYLAKDGGTDEEQRARVEAIVKQWRDSSALPFPNFTDAERAEFSRKLDYPPKGSSQALT